MNERIKELAERATIYIEPTPTSGEGWIFNKEKFAQLILHECAKVALESSHRKDDMAAIVVRKINKHFGVE